MVRAVVWPITSETGLHNPLVPLQHTIPASESMPRLPTRLRESWLSFKSHFYLLHRVELIVWVVRAPSKISVSASNSRWLCKGISFCSLPALSMRWLSVRTPFHYWRDITRLHLLISRTYFQSSIAVVPGVDIIRSLPPDHPQTLNGCTYYKLGSCILNPVYPIT